MTDSYGLLGSGAQADEAEDFVYPERAAFRAVSSGFLHDRAGLIDIATSDPAFTGVPVVAAVGAPGLRRQLVAEWGGKLFRTIVAKSAWVSRSATIGSGAIISPHCVISTRVTVGQHVLLNLGCSVSHESVVGSYVTISPGAVVAGRCHIGDGVFIGAGAVVSDGVTIASGVVVGAGAVVVADIELPGVYIGVPAKRLRNQEGWLHAI